MKRKPVVMAGILLVSCLFGAGGVLAAEAASPVAVPLASNRLPDQMVSDATNRLLAVIEEARGYYEQDPARYFEAIGAILDPMVDFDGMARLVMGKWGTASYYNALPSDAERLQLKQRADRFAQAFRASMIETYGKGVLAFSGERIEVLPVSPQDMASGRVYVIQNIYGKDVQPLVIKYFLVRRSPEEGWKLLNVLIGDVNIGLLYRGQFASAMQRYQEDMGQVIDTWTVNGPPDKQG